MSDAFIRRHGHAVPKYPTYTYTGTHELVDDGNGNWRIKLKTSGTLQFVDKRTTDVFLVGGGGGGGNRANPYSGGGGGGYTKTYRSVIFERRTDYSISVGIGGSQMTTGGSSSIPAFGYVANGGQPGANYGGAGGCGGGGGDARSPSVGGYGGLNGANGQTVQYAGGAGQGSTTREFGESGAPLYGGGGGGGSSHHDGFRNYGGAGGVGGGGTGESYNYYGVAMDGIANTGGGAGGGSDSRDIRGGSGIVIIRNHR